MNEQFSWEQILMANKLEGKGCSRYEPPEFTLGYKTEYEPARYVGPGFIHDTFLNVNDKFNDEEYPDW